MSIQDQWITLKWKLQDQWGALDAKQKRLVPQIIALAIAAVLFAGVMINWLMQPGPPAPPKVDLAALKQAEDAAQADLASLSAMSASQIQTEIKAREAAVRQIEAGLKGKFPAGAPMFSPELNAARAALTRAQSTLLEKTAK